jgi:hypothetical protein
VTVVTAAGETVAVLDLRNGPIRGSLDIPNRESSGEFIVCYVPRGYARPECGGESIPRIITLASPTGRHTARVRINLGQAERL